MASASPVVMQPDGLFRNSSGGRHEVRVYSGFPEPAARKSATCGVVPCRKQAPGLSNRRARLPESAEPRGPAAATWKLGRAVPEGGSETGADSTGRLDGALRLRLRGSWRLPHRALLAVRLNRL